MDGSHLTRRNGIYTVRVRVPDDIRARVGRREIWKSLGTAKLEAAKRLKLSVIREIFAQFDDLRQKSLPTDADLEHMARGYYADSLRDEDGTRRGRLGADVPKYNGVFLPSYEKELRLHVSTGETALVHEIATLLLEKQGYVIDDESAPFRLLCQQLLRVELELCARKRERDGGDFTGQAKDSLLAGVSETGGAVETSGPSATHGSRKALSTLLPLMHAEKKDIAPATCEEHKMVVGTFEDYLGQRKAIGKITKDDILGFKQQLIRTPANRTKLFPDSVLAVAIRKNEAREEPYPILHPKTINGTYLGHLKAILNWAVGNGLLTVNVADKVRVKTGRRKTKSRFPFDTEALRRIFAAPMFDKDAERDVEFWALLIATFSGLRAGEIGQLESEDVTKMHDVWCFRITEWSTHEEARPKKLKTGEMGHRYVPIHPELLAIGLADLASENKKRGIKRLLPDWKPNARGDYSQGVPRWFNRTFLRKVGLKRKGLAFHSFRHSFKDLARTAGIAPEIHDFLTGHAATGVSGGYGVGAAVTTLRDAIAKVVIPGVDLSHLHVHSLHGTG